MKEWLMARVHDLEGFALGRLLPAVIILVIGILAIRLITKALFLALNKTKLEPAAIKLIRSLLRITLYLLLLLIAASAMGIDVTGIVALASVLTLAISLSVQNALSNVIGGFTLLYTKPFVAGDYVEIAGQSGTVADVGLTYTQLSTPDNKIVSLPNSAVVADQIVNYTTSGTRRLDIVVRCDCCTPVSQVTEALLQAAKLPNVLSEPAPFAGARDYMDGTIEYVLQVWTNTDQYWPAKYAINENIQTVFKEKGIALARPQLQLHTEK